MGKIVLLDELTINQIAAGEVIERPASVVKEMVENSIDAGAKNIVIEIKKGGIELIKITDDGSGIAEDDMEIAFERHATSKIRSSSDLENVKSMGFRGEALASIAAIAKVEMISKTADDSIGHKIVVEGGEIKEQTEIGCQKGTTITVQNLFYNTPVRYKFLRKDYTESGYIEDVVTRLALVNKNVAIKLINSGKVVVQTSGNDDMKSTIYSIYGKDVANGIIDVDYDYNDIKIKGVVGKPDIARGNRGYQLFFVNGRYVKDKNLTSAADKAYKDLLPIGKYGFLILNIDINPKDVDVNVHPAKLEVRFSDESLIFKAVYHAIKSVLENVEPAKFPEPKTYNVEEKKNYEPKFSTGAFGYNISNKFDTKTDIGSIESKNDKINIGFKTNEENKSEDFVEENEKKEEKVYSEIEPESELVQPKIRNGFTDLLKKVIRNGDPEREEYVENNLVEALFEERNGKKRTTPDFENFIANNNSTSFEKENGNIEKEFNNNTFATNSIEEKENEKKDFNNLENINNSFVQTKKPEFNFTSEIREFPKKEEDFGFESKIKSEDELSNSISRVNPVIENKIINDVELKTNDTKEEIIKNEEIEVDKKNIEENVEEIIEEEKEIKLEKEKIEQLDNSISGKAIKFGNVSISSDTAEIPIDINDFKNEENDEVENKEYEDINSEKIEVEENDVSEEKIQNEDDFNVEKLTESIVKNKIENSFEPTQLVDLKKIRDNLENTEDKKEITPEFAEMYKKTFGKDISKRVEEKEKDESIDAYNDFLYSTSDENLNVFENTESYIPERKYRYIGNVFESYLIIEMDNEMYIIDQKLAYERIVYEKIKENYYNESKRDSQILLLPDIISLNKKEILIAQENIEMFEKAGFGFEDFGENTLKLYAVPGLCEKLNTKQLFIDILDGLDSVAITAKQEKEEKFITTIAYKSSIKAKMNLDESEIIEIINELLKLQNPFVCSDNKQIAIKMTKIDFEKKFSRR